MALSALEHLVLWGAPALTLLVTFGYYFYWGKEAEETQPEPVDEAEPSADGGGD